MLADVFDWQKQQIWPFQKRQGLLFPHCESSFSNENTSALFARRRKPKANYPLPNRFDRNLSLGVPVKSSRKNFIISWLPSQPVILLLGWGLVQSDCSTWCLRFKRLCFNDSVRFSLRRYVIRMNWGQTSPTGDSRPVAAVTFLPHSRNLLCTIDCHTNYYCMKMRVIITVKNTFWAVAKIKPEILHPWQWNYIIWTASYKIGSPRLHVVTALAVCKCSITSLYSYVLWVTQVIQPLCNPVFSGQRC